MGTLERLWSQFLLTSNFPSPTFPPMSWLQLVNRYGVWCPHHRRDIFPGTSTTPGSLKTDLPGGKKNRKPSHGWKDKSHNSLKHQRWKYPSATKVTARKSGWVRQFSFCLDEIALPESTKIIQNPIIWLLLDMIFPCQTLDAARFEGVGD